MQTMRIAIACALYFSSIALALAVVPCDSPAAIEKLQSAIRSYGTKNPQWLSKIGFWVPYFRMKDVGISVESVSTKGPTPGGNNCEAILWLIPPLDIPDQRRLKMGFGYVISDSLEIDLY
jgi:hypothetical protein